jgi:hypothetical protein
MALNFVTLVCFMVKILTLVAALLIRINVMFPNMDERSINI